MKTILLTTCLFLLFLSPFDSTVSAQTYFHQISKKPNHPPAGDTIYIDEQNIVVDYYQAEENKDTTAYISGQTQLMNKYYKFPTDTSNLYNAKNYYCINSITVAFDSLIDPFFPQQSFAYDTISSLWLRTISIPIIHVHHIADTNYHDTLEIEINAVDAYGYPTSTVLADTMFIGDTLGNSYLIKTIDWNVDYYQIGGKYAITAIYRDSSKQDSCWFIYGYHEFKDTCTNQQIGDTSFAYPTDFTSIPYPTGQIIANSFEVWNEYNAYGAFPTEQGNNVYFPCDTNDRTFHPGIDGANFFQDIHIYVQDTATAVLGIKKIYSPFALVSQNYPNPFNDKSTITYTINKPADVSFKVTDLTGRLLLSQSYSNINPGQHSILVNASSLSPGVYFYTFTSAGTSVTKKMMVY